MKVILFIVYSYCLSTAQAILVTLNTPAIAWNNLLTFDVYLAYDHQNILIVGSYDWQIDLTQGEQSSDRQIVMAREIFGPDYLPYRQEKQM